MPESPALSLVPTPARPDHLRARWRPHSRVLSIPAPASMPTVSFDHNPSIDPLAVDRIEVLRGPAALLLWWHRDWRRGQCDRQPCIARERMTGFSGAIEMPLAARNAKRAPQPCSMLAAAILHHADAFTRRYKRLTRFQRCRGGRQGGRIRPAESRGGAGATPHLQYGYSGPSANGHANNTEQWPRPTRPSTCTAPHRH